jgi:hypothetical protein
MRYPIVAIFALLCCTPDTWSQNLLRDSGFEESAAGGSGSWRRSGQSAVVTDPNAAHRGRCCAKACFDDAVAQQIAIDGGAAYRVSGWIRRVQTGGDEVPKIKIYFLDAGGGRADVQAVEFQDVSASEWHAWRSVVQAPPGREAQCGRCRPGRRSPRNHRGK